MHVVDWFHGRFAQGRPAAADSTFDERVDVECIRREMTHALRDCSEHRRLRAGEKIRRAPGAHELWLLRPEIFLTIAQDVGQAAAAQRINALTPLFRGWVPRASAPRHTRH